MRMWYLLFLAVLLLVTGSAHAQNTSPLVLTVDDVGRTFTVQPGTTIEVQLADMTDLYVVYNPAVLRFDDYTPADTAESTAQASVTVWRFTAVGVGQSALALQTETEDFSVNYTITVEGGETGSDGDINRLTADDNQGTRPVQTGQIVELTFLDPTTPYELVYNPTALQLQPGDDSVSFLVIAQTGSTSLAVRQGGETVFTVTLEVVLPVEPDNGIGSTPGGLVGTRWQLQSYGTPGEETPVIPDSGVTLEFIDGQQLGGSGGCNRYSGSYTAGDDGVFSVGDIISTRMACADPIQQQQEVDYFQALMAVDGYEVSADRLMLSYDGGRLIFTPGQ